MNESHGLPTALSEGDAGRPEERPGPLTGGRTEVEAQMAVRPRQEPAARSSGWTAGGIAALVIGSLLVLLSLALLGGGGTGLWVDLTQREAGYVTTGVHEVSTSRAALATEPTDLGSSGSGWLYAPGLLDKVRIRVTPVCYRDLRSIPGGVDAVVIATRPEIAEDTMRECADLGIKHVWMHWGAGESSVSDAATEHGRKQGITVIDGGCPLMFGPTADFGHKIMRVALAGRLPKQV